ncbi:hypothetical protein BGX27_002322 [Mortierella sp. AM989]|nr:hypothetical protein BGX27_002322 [Mortierella sp. AM989]
MLTSTPERKDSHQHDYPHQSLLNQSTADRRYSFHEGYTMERDEHVLSAKTRRHRSAGSSRRCSSDPSLRSSNSHINNTTTANTNNSHGMNRRASPPKSLSIDHAAFIATYPMLDGLGDTARTSDEEYYGPLVNTASSTLPKSRASSSRVRKQRSQEGLPSSRASTSSLCSLVSDDSMSSCSSSSSLREPLSPTRSPADYHSILRMGSSDKSSKVSRAQPKDLVNFSDDNNSKTNSRTCPSPQSNNFFDNEETIGFSASPVGTESRGQRRLIAH